MSQQNLSGDSGEFFHPDLLIHFQEFERKHLSSMTELLLCLNPIDTTLRRKRKIREILYILNFFFNL